MRIVQMNVTPVAIADPPLLNSNGVHQPYALRTIVELVSEDGISGWGEVAGGAAMLAAFERARAHVVGSDAFALTRLQGALADAAQPSPTDEVLMQRMNPLRATLRVFSGLEVAALDLVGKALGVPVCDLLGGRLRDRVPFSAYLFYKHAGAGGAWGFANDPAAATAWPAARQREALSAETLVEQAEAMVTAFGFRSIKLKAGVLHPDEEVRTIKLLRDAFGPDVPLRIDPNAAWSLQTSLRYAPQLEGLLEYYEDPVGGKETMAALAQRTALPLATNMCCVSFTDLPETIRLGSVRIILGDHHFWGGLRASVELARICRTWGIGLSMHSNSHLGISLAAMTHLAAAVPNLTYACDTHYPWQAEEVIAGGKLQFEDGALPVPTAPGLGVELDRAALDRLHAQYLQAGLEFRDDEREMQKVEPGWKRSIPRW